MFLSLTSILLGSNNGRIILNSAPCDDRFFPWSIPPSSEMIFDDRAKPNPKPFDESFVV